MSRLFLFVCLLQWTCHAKKVIPGKIESLCDFDRVESPPEKTMENLRPCCGDLCRCNKLFALCAEHGSNLTYVPQLRETIVMLNFSSNKLERITELTFSNISMTLSRIKYLWLRQNSIMHINKYAFINFSSIEHLDLALNPISDANVKSALYGLRNFNLKYLRMGHISSRTIDSEIVKDITNIRTLVLNDNKMKYIDTSIFMNLKYLESLDLEYNSLDRLNNTFPSNLKFLMLNSNNLRFFPGFCKNTKRLSLQRIDLSHNFLTTVTYDDIKCLTSLTALCLVNNELRVIQPNLFSSLTNLWYVRIDYAFGQSATGVEQYAFNTSALTELFADELRIDFPKQMSYRAFEGCTNLKTLSMKFNNLFVTENYLMNLFGGLSTLKVLILARCQLSFFPRVISERLLNLEHFDLHGNKIRMLKTDSFTRMKKLKLISLSKNGLVQIKSEIFPSKLRQQLTYIDLANNSLTCTCDNLWFIQWMKKDYQKFKGYPYDYKCGGQTQPESLMIDTGLTEIRCTMSPLVVPVICSFTGLMIVIILISVAYRWRWRIRYYIHMFRYKNRHQLLEEDDLYKYDAFILFCDDDFGFVREHFMPKIEDEGGMTLCVHHRDFTPGRYIVDNIMDNLENSRKVVLLLSNSFSESSWCEFELTVVQTRALEKPPGYLVVILLEELEARKMTSSLCALLQTTTYITWSQREEDSVLFWERVQTCLRQ